MKWIGRWRGEQATARIACEYEARPVVRRQSRVQHFKLRLPQRHGLLLPLAEVAIEDSHQVRRCMILKFPEGGDNALRTCLDERVNDTRDALFSDWPDAGVASRKRDQAGIEMEVPDLAYLEQAVVRGLLLGSEDES